MLTVSAIKRHVGGFVGDTTGRHRLMGEGYILDYIAWAVEDVCRKMRAQGKDYPFFYATHSIDTATDGTGGDYLLPSDFGEIGDIGAEVSDIGTFGMTGVSIEWFNSVDRKEPRDQAVYTVYYSASANRWRIRIFNPVFVNTSTPATAVYTITYKKTVPRLYTDNDEITLFPPDRGFEQAIVYGVLVYAKKFLQTDMAMDPQGEFDAKLAQLIEDLNATSPDGHKQLPYDDEYRFRKSLEGEPY